MKAIFIWIAEKDEKKFSAIDPLYLLGLVTTVKEYGNAFRLCERKSQ